MKGRRKKTAEESKKVPVSITIPMDYYIGLREIEAKELGLSEPRLFKNGSTHCSGLTDIINSAINDYLKAHDVNGYDPVASVKLPDDLEESLKYISRNKHKTHSITVDGVKLSPTRNRLLQRAFLDFLERRYGRLLDEDGEAFTLSYVGEDWQPEIKDKIKELAEAKSVDGLGSVQEILQVAVSEFLAQERKLERL